MLVLSAIGIRTSVFCLFTQNNVFFGEVEQSLIPSFGGFAGILGFVSSALIAVKAGAGLCLALLNKGVISHETICKRPYDILRYELFQEQILDASLHLCIWCQPCTEIALPARMHRGFAKRQTSAEPA